MIHALLKLVPKSRTCLWLNLIFQHIHFSTFHWINQNVAMWHPCERGNCNFILISKCFCLIDQQIFFFFKSSPLSGIWSKWNRSINEWMGAFRDQVKRNWTLIISGSCFILTVMLRIKGVNSHLGREQTDPRILPMPSIHFASHALWCWNQQGW